jgi:hypothetical protein
LIVTGTDRQALSWGPKASWLRVRGGERGEGRVERAGEVSGVSRRGNSEELNRGVGSKRDKFTGLTEREAGDDNQKPNARTFGRTGSSDGEERKKVKSESSRIFASQNDEGQQGPYLTWLGRWGRVPIEVAGASCGRRPLQKKKPTVFDGLTPAIITYRTPMSRIHDGPNQVVQNSHLPKYRRIELVEIAHLHFSSVPMNGTVEMPVTNTMTTIGRATFSSLVSGDAL